MSDNTSKVINAIVSLQNHDDCDCTICQADKVTVASNPDIVQALRKLVK